jgi:hypothetical protein
MVPALRHSFSALKVTVLFALVVVGGCSLNTDVSVGPAGVFKVPDGDGQTAATSTELPIPLQVIVVNQFGELLRDVQVSWTVTSGGGTLSAASTQTDELGVASVTYTTGTVAGEETIQASVAGGTLVVTFSVTVT